MNIKKIKAHIDSIKKHTQEVHTALYLIEIETELDEESNLVEAPVSPTEPTQEETAGRIKENEYWLEMTEKTGKNWAMWHTYNFVNRIKKLRGE